MFNFNSYPELEELHLLYRKLVDQIYKLDFKISKRPNNMTLKNKYDEAYKNCKDFENIYEKAIFDIFSGTKPNMLNRRTNEYQSWDTIFGQNYDKISDDYKGCLICAVEEEGGLFRFPSNYYTI